MNEQVAVLADREIAVAPTGYVVEFGGMRGGPAIGWFAHLGSRGGCFGVQWELLRSNFWGMMGGKKLFQNSIKARLVFLWGIRRNAGTW